MESKGRSFRFILFYHHFITSILHIDGKLDNILASTSKVTAGVPLCLTTLRCSNSCVSKRVPGGCGVPPWVNP